MIFDLAGEGKSVVILVKEKEDFSRKKEKKKKKDSCKYENMESREKLMSLQGTVHDTQWKLNMGNAANDRGGDVWVLPNAMGSP